MRAFVKIPTSCFCKKWFPIYVNIRAKARIATVVINTKELTYKQKSKVVLSVNNGKAIATFLKLLDAQILLLSMPEWNLKKSVLETGTSCLKGAREAMASQLFEIVDF